MATIDLGKIKQVWRGTWSSSPNPAYSIDDLVEYTDGGVTSSYIATAVPGSQAPSTGGTVGSAWDLVAKGVADPIPTQNSGTNGKFLKSDGSSLSFATVTSDYVKLNSSGAVSGTVLTLDNHYTSDYTNYKIIVNGLYASSATGILEVRLLDSSGNDLSNNYYRGVSYDVGLAVGDNFYSDANKSNGYSVYRMHDAITSGGSQYKSHLEFDVYTPLESGTQPIVRTYGSFWDGTDWMEVEMGSFWYTSTTTTRGLKIFNANSVTMYASDIIIYGLKN